MTTPRAYHLVNVFAETRFGGNPLAVFEDGSGLTDAEMQAIAAQMNLSETVFLFPPRLPGCDAHVRIFTPGYELPFAGHPTLGSAAMVRRLGRGGDHVQLGMAAGVFPVRAEGERWQLAAKSPVAQPWVTHTHHLAGALGLSPNEVRAARLIDCGTEQLLVEVCCRETVLNCRPDARLLEAYCRNRQGVAMAYVWHIEQGVATVRLFFYPPWPSGGRPWHWLGLRQSGRLAATGRQAPADFAGGAGSRAEAAERAASGGGCRRGNHRGRRGDLAGAGGVACVSAHGRRHAADNTPGAGARHRRVAR